MKHSVSGTPNAVLISFFLLFLSIPAWAQSSDSQQWGEAVEGVQMSITDSGLVKAGIPKLRVTFRNTRSEDVDLYLGTIGGWSARPCDLDNRKIPCSFNFDLYLTGDEGRTRKLKFKGISYVAGRLDPYIVWLRASSTHTLEIGLDQFWSPDTHEYEFRLAPGVHRVSLEFEGRTPELIDHQQRINKMNFWKGKVRSNILEVHR
ncbi:MAG TPA: hypothetical protein VF791_09330 [Pyrinomonadaceae bacterium]